jgi:hypothetical protein
MVIAYGRPRSGTLRFTRSESVRVERISSPPSGEEVDGLKTRGASSGLVNATSTRRAGCAGAPVSVQSAPVGDPLAVVLEDLDRSRREVDPLQPGAVADPAASELGHRFRNATGDLALTAGE